jgi:tetratricopeptide (TPR) repeat protein
MAQVPQQKIALLEKKVGAGGKSPLFVQLANFYIQQGKEKEALRLCDEGLAAFPHYTTAHLVKGKALLAMKMNAEAKREFEIVQEFLPANQTVAFILSNIMPGEGETLTAPQAEPVAFQPATDTMLLTPEANVVETQETPVAENEEAPQHSGEAPAAEPILRDSSQEISPVEALTSSAQAEEDPFGLTSATTGTEAAPSSEQVSSPGEFNPFEGFPTQPETLSPSAEQSTPEATLAGSIFDFPTSQQEATAAVSGEELFEAYAARMREKLGGGENSVTLEEYLNVPTEEKALTPEPPPQTSTGTIEDLAEKLQSAKKITPVINLSTKATTPASEADTPASTGFVTPTLAEIYAKQGWYDDAIKAYRTLCINKPAERERFEKRITELAELKKQQG